MIYDANGRRWRRSMHLDGGLRQIDEPDIDRVSSFQTSAQPENNDSAARRDHASRFSATHSRPPQKESDL